jgi:hypothetical protein
MLTMLKSRLCITIQIAAILAGIYACGDSSRLLGIEESDTGSATFALKLSKAVAVSLARVEVVVTASDMGEIQQDLALDGETATGTIIIPAGFIRLFTLNGYDSGDNLLYTGSEEADVLAGQKTQLAITMRPIGSSDAKLSLEFEGTGNSITRKFFLETDVLYVIQAEYIQAIIVELIDAETGDVEDYLLNELDFESAASTATHVFNIDEGGEYILEISNSRNDWRVTIKEGLD